MEKQIENMTDQELVDYLFDKVDVKKTIYKMLNLNGNLIVSGFKTEDETQITSTYSNLFNIVSTKLEAGWACVRMVKNEAK